MQSIQIITCNLSKYGSNTFKIVMMSSISSVFERNSIKTNAAVEALIIAFNVLGGTLSKICFTDLIHASFELKRVSTKVTVLFASSNDLDLKNVFKSIIFYT